MTAPVVAAQDLERTYAVSRGPFRPPGRLRAVGGVSFAIESGRTLAIVGESGCGKSTLARMVALIERPSAGALTIDGVDAVDPPRAEAKRLRRAVQLVFQNPYGSLNPRRTVGATARGAARRQHPACRDPSGQHARGR